MTAPLPVCLAGRGLLKVADFTAAEIEAVLDLAGELKGDRSTRLAGQTLGPRLHPAVDPHPDLVLGGDDAARRRRRSRCRGDELQLSRGESIADTARVLSRYVEAVAIRTLSHDDLEQWAEGRVDPGDQRAHRGGASVPGARRRVDDPRPARQPRRRPDRLGRRRHERPRLARRDRQADRHATVVAACPEGYDPPPRHPARARARPARGRSGSRRAGHRHLGEPGPGGARASAACATSSRTGSTRRCSPRPRTTRSSCTACRPTPARRSPPTCSTARSSAVWDEAENRLHVQKALLALLLGAARPARRPAAPRRPWRPRAPRSRGSRSGRRRAART